MRLAIDVSAEDAEPSKFNTATKLHNAARTLYNVSSTIVSRASRSESNRAKVQSGQCYSVTPLQRVNGAFNAAVGHVLWFANSVVA